MYLTGLFSFQDTRTAAFDNSSPSVIAYRGNVYTIVGTAGYALDNKTDLNLEYTYSRSDNFTDNSADCLPLGLDNQRHGLIAGLQRKINDHIIARLRYGWFAYWEGEGLRYRVYPGRGAPLDHPMPLSDLALGRAVATAERLITVIELLIELGSRGIPPRPAGESSPEPSELVPRIFD